jgi:hypothetical protein
MAKDAPREVTETTITFAQRSVATKGGGLLDLLDALRRITAIGTPRQRERVFACVATVFVVLAAFGLRAFRLGVSWDVSEDEITYLQMSQGVLRTLWIVGWDGGSFYLHPPLFFFLEAGYMKLFGISTALDLIQQIQSVRFLNAAFGAFTAGALLWAGRYLAGWPAGIAAAVMFAMDPFGIKMNSRNFLETSALLWVLLGYCVLLSGLAREDHRLVSWRRRTVVAGVLFGLALLTKEPTVFVTLLPLGTCFVLGWALPRTRAMLAGVVALIVYAPYPAIVYAIGDWGTFIDQKSNGALRLAGLLQITGFNQQGGPSFFGAVVERFDEFATTYMFLATGTVAVCVLLLTSLGDTPARRLLVAWTSNAYAFLGYSIVFGTLEEHFFYYLTVSSILATTVAVALVLREVRAGSAHRESADAPRSTRDGRHVRLALQAAAAVFVVALVFWNAYVWITIHTVPDNGYQRVVYYVDELPKGSRVAVTSSEAQLLIKLHPASGRPNPPTRIQWSVQALRAQDIDYVVMSSYLSTRGWGLPPRVYRWVTNHGQLVYGFKGNSYGLLGVWRLQDHAKGATPAIEVAGRGGVVIPWLELIFLCLIAINIAISFFLVRMRRQLLENDKALLEDEKRLLKLWWPYRQRQQEAEV